MIYHYVIVFMFFVGAFVPIINYLQLQQIKKILEKGTNKNT